MKFRFYKVSGGEEKEVEIKTLEELIELIKNTEGKQIIIAESYEKSDYDYDIIDYNDRYE